MRCDRRRRRSHGRAGGDLGDGGQQIHQRSGVDALMRSWSEMGSAVRGGPGPSATWPIAIGNPRRSGCCWRGTRVANLSSGAGDRIRTGDSLLGRQELYR